MNENECKSDKQVKLRNKLDNFQQFFSKINEKFLYIICSFRYFLTKQYLVFTVWDSHSIILFTIYPFKLNDPVFY